MSVRAIARTALSEVTTPGEASRVAQLDAFRLDAELVAIVMDHVNHVMAQTPPRLRGFLSVRVCTTPAAKHVFDSAVLCMAAVLFIPCLPYFLPLVKCVSAVQIYLGKLIRALIAVGSILHNGSTPGMSELGLCFTLLRGSQKPRAADVKELLPLITLQHLLPEAWLQIRHSVASQSLRAAASERSQPWAWTWISAFERLTSLSTLLNLVRRHPCMCILMPPTAISFNGSRLQLMFLYNGRYFTLSQRLTRKVMTHVDPNEGRTVSFEYLNQQLVWGELQHFVMFLLPLLTPGSLAANNFLATATAKVMRFCDVRGV